MLGHYRVLDLTDNESMIAGMVLADLGAEVIAIEPPEGNPARLRGPFAGDQPGPDTSLPWAAWARNKRSVTADLGTDEGRERVRQLAATADVIFESAVPGEMAAHGLGYDDLAEANPALVYVSITPFGSDGPKASYAATDLTVAAASGEMAITGDHDRSPLRISVPQAGLHGGIEGAQAALIALRERKHSGLGQHIDVSSQAALAQATQSTILSAAVGTVQSERFRGGVSLSGLTIPLVWKTIDGYASLTFLFGPGIGPFSQRLMDWILEEGGCDEATRSKDWIGYQALLASGEETPDEYRRVLGVIAAFMATKTKAELLEEGMKRRLLIVPMSSIEDLHDSPQFADRDYWWDVEEDAAPVAGRYPGALAKLSETPIGRGSPAPSIGADDGAPLLDRVPAVERNRGPGRTTAERREGARSDVGHGRPRGHTGDG